MKTHTSQFSNLIGKNILLEITDDATELCSTDSMPLSTTRDELKAVLIVEYTDIFGP